MISKLELSIFDWFLIEFRIRSKQMFKNFSISDDNKPKNYHDFFTLDFYTRVSFIFNINIEKNFIFENIYQNIVNFIKLH